MKRGFVAGFILGQCLNFVAGCWLGYRILNER
jgi:hypothetical protein